ncbi:MAG: AAA family ATPase [Tannerellaceae bacterium]|jgi:exodeoxyribonuclease-5|nr:AAA family ATPase [Tannerellaceae bacterium]
MTNIAFSQLILQNFPYEPTDNQAATIRHLSEFLLHGEPDSIFLIKGYAGTGKTSLVGALVKTLSSLHAPTVLLAPTGRAAKVFSLYAGKSAFTIHRKIYRQKAFNNEPADFLLAENKLKNTIFIVDEASMIANSATDSIIFGSGRLLDDLVKYVYAGENCRLIIMGDEAQLPPVQLLESPALQRDNLAGYNLKVETTELTQIIRQKKDSAILYNATLLRNALRKGNVAAYPQLNLNIGTDIARISGADILEELSNAYARDGIDQTMTIVRTNKRANQYNNAIRSRVFFHEEELSSGDRLMITRNNYTQATDNPETDFFANGEIIHVVKVKKTINLYGFRFADVIVRFDDYDFETDIRILLDTLQAETPTLSKELNDKLFYSVMEDYADITRKAERIKKIKADLNYNAVQVKYAYAITCHKAQGGQWMNIFLDPGYLTETMMGEDFYRWLYTAFTRAAKRLWLINISTEFVKESEAKN